MTADESRRNASLVVRDDHPLIAVILPENGHDVIHYFASEEAADAALADEAMQAALSAIGSWRDLDWEETVEALDRIRHESEPTPPIEL
ncbi:MAG: hypothetical protein ACRDJW_01500 [Thermomicrobiales bacterium]